MVRPIQKRVSAANSSLSSSLESLLKMSLQLQDYTCTGDACGSQQGMWLIKQEQICKDYFIQEAKANNYMEQDDYLEQDDKTANVPVYNMTVKLLC